MLCLGFCREWVTSVIYCVITTTFVDLINGVAYGSIHTSRGLRQGNPLSPYLFLLCAKELSNLINTIYLKGLLSGIPISHLYVPISYLFVADERLVFVKAKA